MKFKRGDMLPVLRATLVDTEGSAVSLAGCTVKFFMSDNYTKAMKVDGGTATIISPATGGIVEYAWGTADLNTTGDFRGEFEITYDSGEKRTAPSSGYIPITIYEDLD